MKSCSRWAAAFAMLAAFVFAGCEVDKTAQPWPAAEKIDDPGVSSIPVASGYYKGRVVEYWDVGPATPAVSRVFVLYRSGSNTAIPFDQQYPIVETVPGDAGYSPFRHVIRVTVPASYVANTMTSVADLVKALYLAQATQTFTAWDAPSVDENATLAGTSEKPTRVWYNGSVGFIFRFADNDVLVNRTTGQIPVTEIEEIVRSGERLEGNTIFNARKGDQGYSPLRRETLVAVTEAYPLTGPVPWQSFVAAEMNLGGYLIETTETETFVNHPIKSIGAYSLQDADLGHVDDSDPGLYPAGDRPERTVWYNNVRRSDFDLGTVSISASDMWLLYRTGTDTPIEGQDAITNSVPGDSAYGEARRIHRVYLDTSASYTPNSIKSLETLWQLGATEEIREVWNAPAVQRDARAGTLSPLRGWVRGQSFHYLAFERDVLLAEDGSVTTMPTYDIYRQRDENDTEGEWLDYNSLMRNAPGTDGYSPYRNVTRYLVSPAYPDTGWTSFSDAANDLGGYMVSAVPLEQLWNRPVRQ